MSKTEIIRTIAQQPYNCPDVIVQACKNELAKDFIIEDARKLNGLLSFNLMHIKICQDKIGHYQRRIHRMEESNAMDLVMPYSQVQIDSCKVNIVDLNKQIESYKLNIKNAIEKL